MLSVTTPPCVLRVALDLRCSYDNNMHKADVSGVLIIGAGTFKRRVTCCLLVCGNIARHEW